MNTNQIQNQNKIGNSQLHANKTEADVLFADLLRQVNALNRKIDDVSFSSGVIMDTFEREINKHVLEIDEIVHDAEEDEDQAKDEFDALILEQIADAEPEELEELEEI